MLVFDTQGRRFPSDPDRRMQWALTASRLGGAQTGAQAVVLAMGTSEVVPGETRGVSSSSVAPCIARGRSASRARRHPTKGSSSGRPVIKKRLPRMPMPHSIIPGENSFAHVSKLLGKPLDVKTSGFDYRRYGSRWRISSQNSCSIEGYLVHGIKRRSSSEEPAL